MFKRSDSTQVCGIKLFDIHGNFDDNVTGGGSGSDSGSDSGGGGGANLVNIVDIPNF